MITNVRGSLVDELIDILVSGYLDDVDVSMSTLRFRNERIDELVEELHWTEVAEAEQRAGAIADKATHYASGAPIQRG